MTHIPPLNYDESVNTTPFKDHVPTSSNSIIMSHAKEMIHNTFQFQSVIIAQELCDII